MRSFLKHIGLSMAILFLSVTKLAAQAFPITVNAQVNQPAPIYFNDYANQNVINGPLVVQLLLSDFSISNRQIRLKAYFEGNGIQFESAPVVAGAPALFIDGGVPLNLGSAELGAYFQPNNIIGIPPNVYANAIPEGSYQFCFEVFDFITGNRLSARSCASTIIFQNEPPFLVLPIAGQEFDASMPQNIVFQWTPRHINVTNVEYELSLVEVWDYQVDPQTAYLSSPPIFTVTTTNTRFLYGVDSPLLLENKRYAWRVQAKAKRGAEDIGLFENQGFSEIFYFDFKAPCNPPTNISSEVKGIYKTNIYWDNLGTDTQNAVVRYRETNNPDAAWFSSRTTENWVTLWDLKEATTYEYQISNQCTLGESSFSQSEAFTTSTAEDAASYYNCGISPNVSLSNTEPLPQLLVDEVFTAGDFPVKVTEVSGSNGRFTGKGRVNIPYLENIGVAVKFSNILVNTDKALAEGMVVTTYDPTMKNVVNPGEVYQEVKETITDLVDQVDDVFDEINDGDHNVTKVDFEIDLDETKVENGKIIVVGVNGEEQIIDYDSNDTYEIVTENTIYRVDKEGNITESGSVADGGAATTANTTGVSADASKGASGVTQLASNDVAIKFLPGEGVYGFDTVDNDYERDNYPSTKDADGNTVYPPHKAVLNNHTDTFLAEVTIKNDSIQLSDLVVKTLSGKALKKEIKGANTIEIELTGSDGYRREEAIVTYKKANGTQVVVGNFFIHHLTLHKPVQLGIVSVNGASTQGVAADIQKIYNQAGITFQFGDVISHTVTTSVWDSDNNGKLTYDGSSSFSNYPKEFTALLKDFAKNNEAYNEDAYYILVSDLETSNPLGGFMPKSSQFGFVFTKGEGDEAKTTVANTAAHELGHGVFSLPHPFEGTGSKTSGTDWLMDYNRGTQLSQTNWAQIGTDKLNLNVINIFQDDEGNEYETDGHYSTVYLVCLMLGMDDTKAESLAMYTEMPDTHLKNHKANLKYTWADGEEQIRTHALNNGFHSQLELITAFEFMNTSNNKIEELGRLLHRYGDSYAHSRLENFDKEGNPIVVLDSIRMYGKPISGQWENLKAFLSKLYFGTELMTLEHLHPDGLAPDLISKRPNWYIKYVSNLAKIISLKFNLPLQFHTNFQSNGINLFIELSNYAKNNSVSLIGIINYEISYWKYKKINSNDNYLFFNIPFARGKRGVENREVHDFHVNNTLNYLKSKSIISIKDFDFK